MRELSSFFPRHGNPEPLIARLERRTLCADAQLPLFGDSWLLPVGTSYTQFKGRSIRALAVHICAGGVAAQPGDILGEEARHVGRMNHASALGVRVLGGKFRESKAVARFQKTALPRLERKRHALDDVDSEPLSGSKSRWQTLSTRPNGEGEPDHNASCLPRVQTRRCHSPTTSTGTDEFVAPPSPSWFRSFDPQQRT
jgi:hypothetical protein